MDSDELIGYGHTPKWVQEQHARMDQATQPAVVAERMMALPLTELGMYGQSMDGKYGWCLCSLCQKPIGGPEIGYERGQAQIDLVDHLRIAHESPQPRS